MSNKQYEESVYEGVPKSQVVNLHNIHLKNTRQNSIYAFYWSFVLIINYLINDKIFKRHTNWQGIPIKLLDYVHALEEGWNMLASEERLLDALFHTQG